MKISMASTAGFAFKHIVRGEYERLNRRMHTVRKLGKMITGTESNYCCMCEFLTAVVKV